MEYPPLEVFHGYTNLLGSVISDTSWLGGIISDTCWFVVHDTFIVASTVATLPALWVWPIWKGWDGSLPYAEVCSSICIASMWSFIFCWKDKLNRNRAALSNKDSASIRVNSSLLRHWAALWYLSLDKWADALPTSFKVYWIDSAASLEIRVPDRKSARPSSTDWAFGVIPHYSVLWLTRHLDYDILLLEIVRIIAARTTAKRGLPTEKTLLNFNSFRYAFGGIMQRLPSATRPFNQLWREIFDFVLCECVKMLTWLIR